MSFSRHFQNEFFPPFFQGAEELNRAVKSMKDISSLLPQMRQGSIL
jgi:hypothetical protein